MSSYKKTMVVDFDGVLHFYRKGWLDGTIYDVPVPGAQAAMQRLLDRGFEVVIFSTRAINRVVYGKDQPGQKAQMEEWLKRHSFPDGLVIFDQPGKPIGTAYIDDRAVSFIGDWNAAIEEAVNLVPWQDTL